MTSRLRELHDVVKAYVYIFVVWGLYRLIFRLPEVIEETVLKPLVFIGGVLLVVRPKRWDKFFLEVWGRGDWLKAMILGLSAGLAYVIFYALASFLAFGSLKLSGELAHQLWAQFLGLGLVTALWEEWLFAGYVYREFQLILKSIWSARLVTAALFMLIHLPILAVGYGFTGTTLAFQLALLFILGVANTVLVSLSRNILSPVLAHTLWGVAIVLFR